MSGEQQCYQASFDLFAPDGAGFGEQAVSGQAEPATTVEETDGVPRGDKPEGYGVYIFTKELPQRQTARCYYILYQPSLWDNYTVQRQWGFAGSEKQQFYTEHFRSPRPALARIRRLIERRLRRGYRLSYAA